MTAMMTMDGNLRGRIRDVSVTCYRPLDSLPWVEITFVATGRLRERMRSRAGQWAWYRLLTSEVDSRFRGFMLSEDRGRFVLYAIADGDCGTVERRA